jgi:hypothetical protein
MNAIFVVLIAAAGLAVGGIVSRSSADTITCYLDNVTMSDGTSLEGSFATNAAGDLLTSDIAVVGGPYGVNGGSQLQTGIAADFIVSSGPKCHRS